jgi:LacI family transcriptional regulator
MTDAPVPPRRRKRAPRFAEIAALAQVSPATVDRVLNERDTVSKATRRRVLEAAAALGVRRVLPAADHGLLHVDILLPRNDTPFFQQLAAAFRDGAAMLDRRVVVHRRSLQETGAAALAEAIRTPPHRRAGFIVAAPDAPAIRAAVAEALARGERGVAVVTDLPGLPGLAYCGVDNRRAGMVAGHLMGRMARRDGVVAVVSPSRHYRAHVERVEGFRAALAGFAGLQVVVADTETRDDPDRCQRALRQVLADHPGGIAGLYNSGAGSIGLRRALLPAPHPAPVWIGHEISPDHIAYLDEDLMQAVIDQDPRGQAIAALQTMLRALGVTEAATTVTPAELRVHTRFSVAVGPV